MAKPKGLGGRIRQARLELAARRGRQVTLQEIGDRLGVAGVTVGRWESDQKEPDLATIERLAQVLGVTASYLAFGVEVPRPENGNVPREETTPAERPMWPGHLTMGEPPAAPSKQTKRRRKK